MSKNDKLQDRLAGLQKEKETINKKIFIYTVFSADCTFFEIKLQPNEGNLVIILYCKLSFAAEFYFWKVLFTHFILIFYRKCIIISMIWK